MKRIKCKLKLISLMFLIIPFKFLAAQEIVELSYKIINSFPTPGPSPTGLCTDGVSLYIADDSHNTIYKISPVDGRVEDSFNSPGDQPAGLEFINGYLWTLDYNSNIFKLDPDNGNILKSIEIPDTIDYVPTNRFKLTGITWDGDSLWIGLMAGWSSKIFRTDTGFVNYKTYFYSTAKDLCFDGNYLWCIEGQYMKKYEIPTGKNAYLKLPSFHISSVTFFHNSFFIADRDLDSLYQIELNSTDVNVKKEKKETPQFLNFKLYQSYPNPFNSSTQINFQLLTTSKVSLIIFDALGNEVIRLVQDRNLHPGNYNILWHGKNGKRQQVSSGLYYYILQTEKSRQTKSILYVK